MKDGLEWSSALSSACTVDSNDVEEVKLALSRKEHHVCESHKSWRGILTIGSCLWAGAQKLVSQQPTARSRSLCASDFGFGWQAA